jgi:hypothetical protein
VFNASGAAVDLAGCEIRVHYQAAVGSTAVTLSGTLAANDVIVVCLGNTSFACDSIAAALPNLTGDDAVELRLQCQNPRAGTTGSTARALAKGMAGDPLLQGACGGPEPKALQSAARTR